MIYLGNSLVDIKSPIGPLEEKEVNFYDWDGKLLYSYTKTEFLASTGMPALPDRTSDNLVQEGWNHTKQDITDKLNIGFEYVCVGCTYHTADDKTHIYHTPIDTIPSLTIHLYVSSNDTVTVDWGDNDTSTFTSGAGDKTVSHTYSNECFDKEQHITITNLEGKTYKLDNRIFNGVNTTVSKILCSKNLRFYSGSSTSDSRGLTQCRGLKYLSVSQYNQDETQYYTTYFLYGCYSLKHINIPSNFRLYSGAFYDCLNIKRISANNPFVTGYYVFRGCYSLDKIDININNLGASRSLAYICYNNVNRDEVHVHGTDVLNTEANTFNSAYTLKKIVISSELSTIYPSTFTACYNLKNIYINSDVPTLSGALTAPNSFYRIYVPRTYYTNWTTATNWVDIANHIYPYDFN